MTLPDLETAQGAVVLTALILSIPTRARAAGDSALALAPLAFIWMALPALRGSVIESVAEAATFLLLLRTAFRHDRRLPIVLSSLALVAVVADFLALLGPAPRNAAYGLISQSCWIVAILALCLNFLHHLFFGTAISQATARNPH